MLTIRDLISGTASMAALLLFSAVVVRIGLCTTSVGLAAVCIGAILAFELCWSMAFHGKT